MYQLSAGKPRQIMLEFSMNLCYNTPTMICGISLSVEFLLPKQTGRVRLPYPAPKDNTAQMGGVVLSCRKGSRTDVDATVRGTVARDGSTGRNNNFAKQNANRLPYPAPKNNTAHLGGVILSYRQQNQKYWVAAVKGKNGKHNASCKMQLFDHRQRW